jgi:hypothetical protein
MIEPHFKPDEAAGIARTTANQLKWLRHVGRGPAYVKLDGGRILYPESALKAWLEADRREPQPAA